MTSFSKLILRVALVIWILPLGLTGCKASSNESSRAANQPAVVSADTSNPSQTADDAPPPEKTGGFDGKRAFAHVAKQVDRKSTRLNSSHGSISYAVFCLKKKNKRLTNTQDKILVVCDAASEPDLPRHASARQSHGFMDSQNAKPGDVLQ